MKSRNANKIPPLTNETIKAFNSMVEQTESGCWQWRGDISAQGNALFSIEGKLYQAHRIAYAIANKQPGTLAVFRSCHNHVCVNPDHLTTKRPKPQTASTCHSVSF